MQAVITLCVDYKKEDCKPFRAALVTSRYNLMASNFTVMMQTCGRQFTLHVEGHLFNHMLTNVTF